MERRKPFTVVALTTFGLLALACSSTGSTGRPTSADAGVDGAPDGRAAYRKARETVFDAFCELQARCTNVVIVTYFGDVTKCKARRAQGIVTGAPGQAYDQARADACAAALSKLDCLAYDATTIPVECRARGTLADGASCDLESQCASGQCYHANPASAACGVCKPFAGLGEDCSDNNCDPSFVCVRNQCVAKKRLGEACNSTDKPCLTMLNCIGGACVGPAGIDQPCGDGSPLPACDFTKELTCNAATDPGKCVPVPYANLGERCGADTSKGLPIFCRDGHCPGMEQLKIGACTAYATRDQACNLDLPCESPLECLSGTCRLRDPASCE